MEQEPLGFFGTLMWLWDNWDKIILHWHLVMEAFIGFIGAIVLLASIITPLTKTPRDDEAMAWLKNWLHQFSITNAKDVKGIGQNSPVPPQNTELTRKGD